MIFNINIGGRSMEQVYDTDKRKLLSALSHGSVFLSSLIFPALVPIAILLVSDDPVVKQNAKESLNFDINVWLYGIVFGLLTWVLIGFPLLVLLFVFHWVMPALAVMHCLRTPDQAYRYPFIFRLL
jgi:uncharacterized Tic20 family protein